MKVFQIVGDICHWHARDYATAADAAPFFSEDCVFVDAPDEVHEGWGYLDGAFIKPTPPEGFLYDDATGTFYEENSAPPLPIRTIEELTVENRLLRAQIATLEEITDFQGDVMEEIIAALYA